VGILAAMAASGTLGFVVEKIAYKPLRRSKRLTLLLSAIGMSIVLMNVAAFIYGTRSKRYPYPFDNSPIALGPTSITPHQILILVVVVVMMVALKLFIDRSRLGKAMRATSLDQDVARLMGINVDTIISLTFIIGSSLAAVAGVLMALDFKVYPTMGTMAGLKAFVAAVVGGIGNITGAMVGGIILGIAETFGVAFLGIPVGLRDTIAFSILIIILLVRPEGIMGRVEREKV
ncbi:MAG: branched-chain amino acid ABC transporter permease, partial [Spirochaetota bacterium]